MAFASTWCSTCEQKFTNDMEFGEWAHWCVVSDTSYGYFYKNGVMVKQGASGSGPLAKVFATIGGYSYGTASYAYFFEGVIDNLYFVHSALTADEIVQVYEATEGTSL